MAGRTPNLESLARGRATRAAAQTEDTYSAPPPNVAGGPAVKGPQPPKRPPHLEYTEGGRPASTVDMLGAFERYEYMPKQRGGQAAVSSESVAVQADDFGAPASVIPPVGQTGVQDPPWGAAPWGGRSTPGPNGFDASSPGTVIGTDGEVQVLYKERGAKVGAMNLMVPPPPAPPPVEPYSAPEAASPSGRSYGGRYGEFGGGGYGSPMSPQAASLGNEGGYRRVQQFCGGVPEPPPAPRPLPGWMTNSEALPPPRSSPGPHSSMFGSTNDPAEASLEQLGLCMRDLYRHYARGAELTDHRGRRYSALDFQDLLRFAQAGNFRLNHAELVRVYRGTVRSQAGAAAGPTKTAKAGEDELDVPLSFELFVEVLIEIARCKFPEASDTESVAMLFEEVLLPLTNKLRRT